MDEWEWFCCPTACAGELWLWLLFIYIERRVSFPGSLFYRPPFIIAREAFWQNNNNPFPRPHSEWCGCGPIITIKICHRHRSSSSSSDSWSSSRSFDFLRFLISKREEEEYCPTDLPPTFNVCLPPPCKIQLNSVQGFDWIINGPLFQFNRLKLI